MHCACKDSSCRKQVHLDAETGTLTLAANEVDRQRIDEITVHLDLNLAVELARQLRRYVLRQMEKD